MTATRYAVKARWFYSGVPGSAVQENRFIVVEGKRIAAILDAPPADMPLIDDGEGFALPGLINIHNHCFSAPLFRGIADDISEASLGGNVIYSLLMPMGEVAVEVLDADEIRSVVELTLIELIKGGATTVLDIWRLEQWPFLDAAKAMGIRAFGCPYLFSTRDLNIGADGLPSYAERPGETGSDLEKVLALYDAHDQGKDGLVRVGFGPHGVDSCTPELLTRTVAAARERGVPFAIHLAQSEPEVALIAQRYGKTPIEHLRDLDALGPGTIVAHCVHATDADLEILRATDTALASCPLAYARSATAVPFDRFLASGVRLGIGTDGVSMDMVTEMRAAGIVAKIRSGESDRASARQILECATTGGAGALGRSDLGRIEPGAAADILLMDLGEAKFQPVFDPLKSLVWSATGGDVSTVIIDGKPVMRRRQMVGIDERAAIARAAAAVQKVWAASRERGFIKAGA